MIWGGISWEGPTPLAILRPRTKVDGGVYQSILHNVYLDWARKTYGGKVVLVQDNAPSHVSESTRGYMQMEGIQVRCAAAEPDDHGYKFATFTNAFENDPDGWDNPRDNYNLNCTFGFKNGQESHDGLSCTGGLCKDGGRCVIERNKKKRSVAN
ncbi:hypothetical protein PRIPAC_90292 [Pristionchus pacificus]|uniref:Uncharacterized protein n=1 Tax=Pristionchus pacificus TaxID=54126 RepID=A0A2A6CYJ2_PRIPA|nr:hypothetical protein PRIPAC_90292 [Pristionchus pacificus]|eukprot:PDM83093.1 hypothetical protein PRIPAC_37486 [Pristionchus pacificus]